MPVDLGKRRVLAHGLEPTGSLYSSCVLHGGETWPVRKEKQGGTSVSRDENGQMDV